MRLADPAGSASAPGRSVLNCGASRSRSILTPEQGERAVAPLRLCEADLARLADLVAERLAPMLSPQASPKYADKDSNPYGRPRAFLDAARAKSFPVFRLCRRVTALWSDVEAAIEHTRTAELKREPAIGVDAGLDIDKLLEGAKPKRREAA